ncbi:MAG: DUF3817 domain-containing protein [Chitinophagaceae bacterium]|nr:DUF3817 domain-containing protein [Chitinophagaceae bacterium]
MNKLTWLRKIGLAEGVSFLVLLLIAMPLKYFADMPKIVTYVGWAHGVLFVAFLLLALDFKSDRNKSFQWLVLAFLAALVPLGTFLFDRKLRKEAPAL